MSENYRETDPETSQLGWESVDAERDTRAVLAYIRAYPGRTAADIEAAMGDLRNPHKRVSDLVHKHGLAVYGEKSVSKSTGRMGLTVWPKGLTILCPPCSRADHKRCEVVYCDCTCPGLIR